MDEMRRDTDKSILLCFQETSSESCPQFSRGSPMGLKQVPAGMEGALRVLGGLRRQGLPAPSESSAGGGVQESAGPRLSRAREQVPRPPARRAVSGLSDARGSPQAAPFASPLPFQRLHSAGFSSSSSALS